VYKDFLYTDEPYFTPAQVERYRERVVRIFSFSKAYAMTGWRVGYLHTARGLATEILKVHDALVTCAPVISQHAAVAALEYGAEAVAGFRAVYRRRRDLTLEHLDRLSHIFDYQKPNGAYFVFPRVKDTVPLSGDSRLLALDLLEKARVAVVPGIAFGPTGESHLRMSFGREEAEIEEAFSRMRSYFQPPRQRPRAADSPGAGYPLASAPAGQGQRAHPTAAVPPTRLRRRARGLAVAYLSLLARIYLRRKSPTVVAIAGNRGKTVCKRTVTDLLRRNFVTRANPRSYNTEIGLPLAVLGLEINPRRLRHIAGTLLAATWRTFFHRDPLELLVLEMGTRQRGDMAGLLRTVRPAWAIITNLTPDEGGEPGEMAVLQDEMALLARRLPPSRLIVGGDDALLRPLLAEAGGGALTIGRARLRPAGRGYLFSGEERGYAIGGELVGASALFAVQAAVVLGEKLGMGHDVVQAFLNEASGSQ
ncbi:MAG: aminotransferase class I/II-fold pyridoxal phosphate-dependent enzyme, partial [bacterium]